LRALVIVGLLLFASLCGGYAYGFYVGKVEAGAPNGWIGNILTAPYVNATSGLYSEGPLYLGPSADVNLYRSGENQLSLGAGDSFGATTFSGDLSLGSYDLSTTGTVVSGNLGFTDDFFWGAVNRTDTLAYPEQAASYIIWKDGSTISAKNGHTGQIDYSGTDAATVINVALNGLTAGRTWKEKVLVKGNFTIVTTISIPSYTILEIQGKLKLADSSPIGTYMLASVNSFNIEIFGGLLDGNMANQDPGLHAHIIHFSNVANALIQDIETINASYDHIILTDGSKDIVIDSWIGDGGRGDGFNPLEASNIIVKNSIARNMIVDGFHISDGSSQVSVIGCISYNNTINGISIYNSHRNVVEGNIVYGNHSGIYLMAADASYNNILNNQIMNNTQYGIIANAVVSDYLNISGNIITGGTAGLRLINSKYCTIQGNLIQGVAGYGIVLTGGATYGYHIVTDNIIKDITDGDDGIYLNNNYNLVSNNIIKDVASASVREEGGIDHNTITDNEVTQTIVKVGANTKVQRNIGFVTENSGFATITTLATSIVVNHGLSYTPSAGDIMVTPTTSLGAASYWYVNTYTSTQFTIHLNVAPTTVNVTLAWNAQRVR
jgi:parallel beta-helix repeat protein